MVDDPDAVAFAEAYEAADGNVILDSNNKIIPAEIAPQAIYSYWVSKAVDWADDYWDAGDYGYFLASLAIVKISFPSAYGQVMVVRQQEMAI